jgi:integrase
MGSTYQVKSGRYKGQWRGNANLPKRYDADKNKWVYPKKVVYGVDEQDVKRQVNEIENQVYKNTFVDSKNTTVAGFLNLWIDTYCPNLQETTQALYKMYIRVHIVPHIGQIKLKDLLPIHIQQYYNKLIKGGYSYKASDGTEKVRVGMKGQTVRKIHTLLNRAFKDAEMNKLLYKNPCDAINTKIFKKIKYAPRVYSEQEIHQLLTIAEGTFDEVCIVLAGFCALRRGEVFGLRPRDIDYKNGTITIVETKTKFDKWVIKEPKSETSQRTIKAPRFVLDIIKNYLSTLKVVPERICDKYTPDSYSKHFSKLLDYHGLPHIRFHDLRHFAGSILAKYNVPRTTIKDYMGHADEQTTSIYTHSLSDMADLTSEVMTKVYGRK